MTAVAIVGAQWGDEGKGKVVDRYTESAEVVVRFAGGPNAGHTLVVGGDKVIVRLLPSGILRRQATCLMAQGMVIDLDVLIGELDALAERGLDPESRLWISHRAHVILPFHRELDALREQAAASDRIGTTKKGIGPCYEDKAARRGLRVGDLRNRARATEIVGRTLAAWDPVFRALGAEPTTAESVLDGLWAQAARIAPRVADTSDLLDEAIRAGKRVLLEGAQGTLLDLDHGTYPFVTSSSAVAGGACAAAGIGPTRLSRVIGIAKAYLTRVGSGPFPTELFDEVGETLQRAGAEFGSVTGRPRRTGWLDLPALRYAARVNGLDGLAITKLDVLTGLEELRICTAYDTPAGRTTSFPIDELADVTPVYETMPGWHEPIADVKELAGLPAAARAYVERIERDVGVPAFLVSVGPGRDETIIVAEAFGA